MPPPIAARQEFSGAEANLTASFDACEILASLRAVESVTGARRDIYTFVITPEVNATAMVAGQPVESRFAPRLVLLLDDLQMVVLRENPEADPLLPLEVKEIATNTRIANRIRLPGFSLTVGLARVISGLGLFSALAVGGFLAFSIRQSLKKNPLEAVAIKYGGRMADVAQFPPGAEAREAQAASIDDLARLAEHSGSMILRVTGDQADEFAVDTGQAFYRFVMKKGDGNDAQ